MEAVLLEPASIRSLSARQDHSLLYELTFYCFSLFANRSSFFDFAYVVGRKGNAALVVAQVCCDWPDGFSNFQGCFGQALDVATDTNYKVVHCVADGVGRFVQVFFDSL